MATTWSAVIGVVGAPPDPPHPSNSTLAPIWHKAFTVHRLCADISRAWRAVFVRGNAV
jgi:hypothetical protein